MDIECDSELSQAVGGAGDIGEGMEVNVILQTSESWEQLTADVGEESDIEQALRLMEERTGLCFDWPDGTYGEPVLVPIETVAERPSPLPCAEIEIEKAANQ